jgi:LysM repeat protein
MYKEVDSLSPIRKKGISGSKRAITPNSTDIIPEPPECEGFTYIVKPNDNLYKISKVFNCPMSQLLQANPQLGQRLGTIFIRQRICIPDVVEILPINNLLPIGPQVLFVELLNAMGNELPVTNGFVHLAPRTFIRVMFDQPVNTVYFFFVPNRKLILRPSFLIGLVTLSPPARSVRFVWNVPRGIRGSLFIVGCNQVVCGPPQEILVTRP